MSMYDGLESGKKIEAGLRAVARSIEKLADAANVAATAYAQKVEHDLNPPAKVNPWPARRQGESR